MAGMADRVSYLDHAATTPLRPEAREAMLPWLGQHFGNPSGSHSVARAARKAIDEARDSIAAIVGCAPNEVVFTGGGTEADNLAIGGSVAVRPGPVLCSAVEHHAVLEPVEHIDGRTVSTDRSGRIDLDALAVELKAEPTPTVVSVMLANNEVGVIQALDDVARAVRRHAPEATIHTDAVQAAAWLDLAEAASSADLISVSAHKLGGPQGVGALVARRRAPLRALQLGGGQEREVRSGTHNVAGIVGMAAAFQAKAAARTAEWMRVAGLRDRLATGLRAAIPDVLETAAPDGDRSGLLPATLHLMIPGAESEALLFLLDEAGVCASAASACASGAQQASHVLAAMGVPLLPDTGALRLTLGWTSGDEDVAHVLEVLPAVVERLRPNRGMSGTVDPSAAAGQGATTSGSGDR